METFVLFSAFIGSWLLVAGSIYQAGLELKDQDIERDRIRDVAKSVTPPSKVSNWWWLLPPAKLILEHRRDDEYRRAYLNAITVEDAESLISFVNKATAWLFVSLGGLLIAVKETYDLLKPNHDLTIVWFFVLIVFMLFLSIINTTIRFRRARTIIQTKKQ